MKLGQDERWVDCHQFFATNFDPETNLTEILENPGYWEDRQWKECKHHTISKTYDEDTIRVWSFVTTFRSFFLELQWCWYENKKPVPPLLENRLCLFLLRERKRREAKVQDFLKEDIS